MFSVVPMMRLQTIVLAQDERAVLTSLGQLGTVHLTRMLSGPDTAPLAPIDRTGELARYGHIRARIQELRTSLEIPSLPKEPRRTEKILSEAEEGLRSMEQQSAELLENRQHLVQRQKELAVYFRTGIALSRA